MPGKRQRPILDCCTVMGDSGNTADTAVTPRDGDGLHGNTVGTGISLTVTPWVYGDDNATNCSFKTSKL